MTIENDIFETWWKLIYRMSEICHDFCFLKVWLFQGILLYSMYHILYSISKQLSFVLSKIYFKGFLVLIHIDIVKNIIDITILVFLVYKYFFSKKLVSSNHVLSSWKQSYIHAISSIVLWPFCMLYYSITWFEMFT